MSPLDLLESARFLLGSKPGRPSAVACRRALSACYYALFHYLARQCADLLIGGPGGQRSEEAWQQVYRALDHRSARERCRDKTMISKFPKGIEDFANSFVALQSKRHEADYDPFARFAKSSVQVDIEAAAVAIASFAAEPVRDRRAFCAYVLLKRRG